jgi:hypothetical protein
MASRTVVEQLDHAIDAIVARGQYAAPDMDASVSALLQVGGELRDLPRADFKARHKADLEEQAFVMAAATVQGLSPTLVNPQPDFLPTLCGKAYGSYPVHRTNFLLSFAAHAAAVAFILTSGMWIVQKQTQSKPHTTAILLATEDIMMPVAPTTGGGGGGGGDHDKLEAVRGKLPNAAMQQLAPPAVVIRNEHPVLPVEPTVVLAPQMKLPLAANMPNIGDPLSHLPAGPPSNGTGGGGGIGSGYGGGIGSGSGPGVGPGR